MGVIRIPKLRCAHGALLGVLLLLLPEIEMRAQSGDPTFSDDNWSSLGAGVNGSVIALAASGSDLYAGGSFTTADGISANFIAKWDGSSWSALGSGLNGHVYALTLSSSDMYAGGRFSTAGGNQAYVIAKWNGSSWSALGSGLNNIVWALAASGSDVYVGGDFRAGSSAGNYIAKWDGSSWMALGSGMNNSVWALAQTGSDLYAGGLFSTAGGNVSAYVARAYLPTLPTLSMSRSGTEVMISWPSVDSAGFELEQNRALADTASWIPNTASVSDDGTNKPVSVPATNSAQFFRLSRP